MSVSDICILAILREYLEEKEGIPSTEAKISFPAHSAERCLRGYLKACSKEEWRDLFMVVESRRSPLPWKDLLEAFADKGVIGGFLRSQTLSGERFLILRSVQEASYLLNFISDQQQAHTVVKYFKKIKILASVCEDAREIQELKSRIPLEFDTIKSEFIFDGEIDPSQQKRFFSEVLEAQFPETLP